MKKRKNRLPANFLRKAKLLRITQTESEKLLWAKLRNRKFQNLKFRRQHPILPGYILDFYCDKHKLGIEIDGSIHNTPDKKESDDCRSQILGELGITLIRFSNKEVIETMNDILIKIKEQCSPSPRSPSPQPRATPLQKREGKI